MDFNPIYLNSRVSSSMALACEVDANVETEVTWKYFLHMNDKGIVLRNQTFPYSKAENKKISSFQLKNLTGNETGYYSCLMSSNLEDSLGNITIVRNEKTHYLDVQCKILKKLFYKALVSLNTLKPRILSQVLKP